MDIVRLLFTSFILAVLITLCFYRKWKYWYSYWQKRGIPCANGCYPGIGHMWMLFTKAREDFGCKIYNENKKHSMVGIYNGASPSLMILEPQLIKTVMQTNFTSFYENGLKIDPKLNPLAVFNPFFSNDKKWVNESYCISAFSIRLMEIMLESVKSTYILLETFLDKKLKKSRKVIFRRLLETFLNKKLENSEKVIEIELKDLFSRFTAQTMADATLGLKGFCFDEENKHKSFWKKIKTILEPSIRNKLKFTIIFFMPALNKLLRFRFLPKRIDHIIQSIVELLMKYRRAHKIMSQNDFLQLMIEFERLENVTFDVKKITSYTTSIIIDGFETSSTVLSFVGFQLAAHPEVQNKLRNEILSVINKHDGDITYEALKDMMYMDQVINESIRLVAPTGFVTKYCTKEFELIGSDGLTCRVQPGTEIMIPFQAFHIDSRYWKNPHVYDPDRFDLKRSKKYSFLPFGLGPQKCRNIGMRMIVLQMKACLATLLRNYSFELSPKTRVPLRMMVGTILPTAKGGLWVKLRKI